MYSWYSPPKISRQALSSAIAEEFCRIMDTIDSNKNTHDAEATLTPIKVINIEKYPGCLEKQYIPLVKGLPSGVVATLMIPVRSITSPTR